MNPPNSPNVLAFLQELFKRFSTKSPLFFRIWQWISGILMLITGVPTFLDMLGVVLPAEIEVFTSKIISAAALGVFFMSMLTTQSTPVAITEGGTVVKETNAEKLPFTSAAENKSAEKTDVPKIDNI